MKWHALLAVILALSGVACSDEEESSDAVAVQGSKTKAKQQEQVTEEIHEDPVMNYSYSPVGKRDPFQSYLVVSKGVQERVERRREATEEYELDQYKITAVVTGTSRPRAMVEDPTGRGHAVQIGSRLGKNAGVVTRITNEGVVVTEEFRAPTGEKVRVPITLRLPQPELEIGTAP